MTHHSFKQRVEEFGPNLLSQLLERDPSKPIKPVAEKAFHSVDQFATLQEHQIEVLRENSDVSPIYFDTNLFQTPRYDALLKVANGLIGKNKNDPIGYHFAIFYHLKAEEPDKKAVLKLLHKLHDISRRNPLFSSKSFFYPIFQSLPLALVKHLASSIPPLSEVIEDFLAAPESATQVTLLIF